MQEAEEELQKEFAAVGLLNEEFPEFEPVNKKTAEVKLKEEELAAAAPRAGARAPWPRCPSHTKGVGS